MSVKLLLHVWGPHCKAVMQLMIVTTFLGDSIRTIVHWELGWVAGPGLDEDDVAVGPDASG